MLCTQIILRAQPVSEGESILFLCDGWDMGAMHMSEFLQATAGDENAQVQIEISGQAAAVRIGGKSYLSETVNSVQELA